MPPKSNFKRAMPQGQSSVVSALRTTEMIAESKAILPAGTLSRSLSSNETNLDRIDQYHPRLPARRGHVQIRPNLEAHARDGLR